MAYTRRSASATKARKPRTSTKKTYRKAAVPKQLAVLKRQVKKLTTVSYDKVQTYHTPASGALLSSTYNSYLLNGNWNNAQPMWGYSATDLDNCDKAYVNKLEVLASVRQNNEPNLIRYSMFLVSLKDQGADSTTFDPALGGLTLSSSIHYVVGGFADQVRISPRFFNIHAVRRFTMGYEGSVGPTADTYSEKRFKFNIIPKQKLVQNPKGNVFNNASFTFPKDPSQNYFLILFNDNSQTDLENNKLDISVVRHMAIAS